MPQPHAALKWSFLSELASKTVAPVVFVILARLLSPEDFGVVIAATIVISFTQVFWEAGMGKAIIQYGGERDSAANAAFWVNLILGILVTVLLLLLSGPIAEHIFHDSRVTLVLRVMAIQVLLSASVSVQTALLQKDLNFQHLFWVRLTTVTIPGLASIPLALYGMGYWALVVGSLVGQLIQTVILWNTSPWRPRAHFDPIIARKLIGFGAWVAASGLLVWFYTWADSFIVGLYFGPFELGLYRTGNAFVMMIFGVLFSPVMPVLYSHLSRHAQDKLRVRDTMNQVIRILTFLSLPLAAILFVSSDFIGPLVFGGQWNGISLVIAAMALMHGVSWVVGANGEAYRAVGLPAWETRIMAITLAMYLVGYMVSVHYGFSTFIWTRFGLAVAASSVHFWVMARILKIKVTSVLAYIGIVSIICFAPILVFSQLQPTVFSESPTLRALCLSLIIISSLLLLERNRLLPQIYQIVRKAIRQ
ncbi:lipopolysaccharide biosynthesis protein [Pseudomonadota bacterium]